VIQCSSTFNKEGQKMKPKKRINVDRLLKSVMEGPPGCLTYKELQDFSLGKIKPGEKCDSIARHIESCQCCRQIHQDIVDHSGEELPSDFWEAIKEELKK